MRAMMKTIISSSVKKTKLKASSSRCNVVRASFLSEESINARALSSRRRSTNVRTSFSSERFASNEVAFWKRKWACVWASTLNKWKTIVKYWIDWATSTTWRFVFWRSFFCSRRFWLIFLIRIMTKRKYRDLEVNEKQCKVDSKWTCNS